MLALGWIAAGTPWAGVLLATGGFCGLCYWMLRGWTSPQWALLGGVLAALEFGPLNQWTNSYWGGGLTAAAGCLVFGALPRLREYGRIRHGMLLGAGLGIHLMTRPYETVFLMASAVLFWRPVELRRLARPLAAAVLIMLPALGVTLLHNKRVTGEWTRLPYAVSQQQYGVPASLTFQPHPAPQRVLTREQELDYRMQRGFRSQEFDSVRTYFDRLLFRTRYYRFFFYAPLYPALLVWLIAIRGRRTAWVAATVVLFALGVNFFPAFQLHYMAAVTCLFVLMSVEGLRRLGEWPGGGAAARALVYLCIAQFCFFYAAHLFETREWSAPLRALDVWDGVDPSPRVARRIAVRRDLAKEPGQLLVLVRYWPQHIFQEEWVWNEAAIDASRVVWARDLGDEDDAKLFAYYPARRVLVFEPDATPPRFSPYAPEQKPEPVKPATPGKVPQIVFEPVR